MFLPPPTPRRTSADPDRRRCAVREATGLIVGLTVDKIGTAAAVGLSIYFVLAVGAHIRVRDRLKGILPAIGMLAISVATLATSL
ncbi:MAG: DoxX family protein [Candidatus Limnocylindrus sp.]